jgi:tetratricopeptide (TPR) repeat protein
MRRLTPFFLTFAFILVLSSAVLASEKPWTEIRSPHFRVLTNGSEPDARKVAIEFEQLRAVFAGRFANARLESGAPLVVFAVRNEETALELEPHLWKKSSNRAGEFHHGWEKQFAIVRLDSWNGEGAKEVVYHEYTHTIEHLNMHYIPLWLDEGTAEFYGFTRIERGQVFLGAPTERYRTLRDKTPIPVETLISVGHNSPYYLDATQNQRFYAEAWALVHYLIYGKDMEHGKRLNQFIDLVQQGIPQKKAFLQVFGDYKSVDKALDAYMLQPTFTTSIVKDTPKIDEKELGSRVMSAAETEAELGIYHLWTHDLEGARSLIEQALKDDPKLGLAHEAMGFLDFNEGKDADALQEFTQASSLDGKLYLSSYYKAMLSPQAKSIREVDINDFGASLGRVLQANPDFAPAYVQLAKLAVQVGDFESALKISRKAEELDPSLAGYHLLTGQVLRRMGKTAEAADYAKYVAERWFGPDHDEAIELVDGLPPAQRPALEPQSESTTLKDALTAEGTVKSSTCGKDESFVVDHNGQTLTFHRKGGVITGFSDTLWYGEDHFSLCRHLEGLRAVIRYRSPSDSSYAGDIVEMGIRDDLPKTLGAATSGAASP